MDNQTQQAGTNTVTASDGTQLNPLAVNLAKAIRLQEGGGKVDYGAVGDSGTSTGAYQFHGDNFKNWASQYGLNPNDFSPVNQDKVAYARINDQLQQGRAPSEIAAMWNGAREENGKMVPINPAYVEGVKKYYGQIVGNGSVGGYPSPSSVGQESSQGSVGGYPAPQQPQQTQDTTQQQVPQDQDANLTGIPIVDSIGNMLGKGVGFLFPALGDIKSAAQGNLNKTPLQVGADVGMSVLPFTGVGDVGEGLRAAGLLGENSGAITRLLTGAATGYGYGALGNLSQGQSIGQAISPNMGTLGGAALGGAANAILPKILAPFAKNLTKGGAQSALEDSLGQEASRLKPTQRIMADMPNAGKDAIETIARTPDALPQVVDNHHYDTTQAQQIMENRANTLSQLRASALDKMGVQFSLEGDLQRKAIEMLNQGSKDAPDRLQRGEQMMQQISEYARNYGGDNINATQLEKIKESNPYASPVARAARWLLEQQSETEGMPDLKLFNREIQKHIHAQQILEKMQGQVVKGGNLGKYLRRGAFDVAGTVAGTTLGGGFLGTLGGALAGDKLSELLSAWQSRTALSSPLQEAILERLATEDPQIVQQYAQSVGRAGTVIPQRAAPTATKIPGTLRNLLISSGARGMASVGQ